MRESPSLNIVQRVVSLGADLHYLDDHVTEADVASVDGHLVRAELNVAELAGADAVVVLTDHDDVDYDLVVAHASYVLDTRHRCRGDVVEYL